MLLTDRRRAFGRREEDEERDPWQGSLFAPDALAPPARPPGPTPDPFARPRTPAAPPPDTPADAIARAEAVAPATEGIAPTHGVAQPADTAPPSDSAAQADLAAPPPDAVTPADFAAPPAEAVVPGFAATDYDPEVIAPEDYVDDPAELEPAHARGPASRSVLAGPTLDDVMSRAWEGLRAEVPTPCPVCHTEIEPSAHGRCGACGSTLA